MFYSEKYKLLFIASPKSGSTSVEKFLFSIDENGENHSLTIDGHSITLKKLHQGVLGHAKAWELKQAIGDDYFNELHVFGFVRNPIDKLISTYFYYKNKSPLSAFKNKGKNYSFNRKIKEFLTKLAPWILPINLWAIFFPMKSSYEYFYDQNGNRLVGHLGRTDHLDHDLDLILSRNGIEHNGKIPHINKSTHSSGDEYFRIPLLRSFIERKYKLDLDLYKKVEKEIGELP